MKTRTLIVDGNHLLKRSYHGNTESVNSNGVHIGCIYSFLTKIRQLVTLYKINKVVVAFDGDLSGQARHDLDPLYKSKRKSKSWYDRIELSDHEIKKLDEEKESILYQKKRIQCYLEELFVRQLEADTIEADDLIAQYCIDHHEIEDLYLATNDRDFLQMLYCNLTILFANMDIPITKNNFFQHFNYHYLNAINMKIIGGDVSDTITGLGMHEDSLIKYFPDIQFKPMKVNDILVQAKLINEERVSKKLKPLKCLEKLINGKERLKLNYLLVNLSKPMLNEAAEEELAQLELPLSPVNRGSKNLLKLMMEDGFLVEYKSTFVNYVTPFYTVIMYEKSIYDEYIKNNK